MFSKAIGPNQWRRNKALHLASGLCWGPGPNSPANERMSNRVADIDGMRFDLIATQYWMKICFISLAQREIITARDIKKLLVDLMTESAEDSRSRLLPEDWYHHRDEYYAAFERMGLSIASLIDGIE
jgi:hypothetical protein